MKQGIFLVMTLTLAFMGLQAQTLKTDVAVVGHGNAAWAAGLQAAKSGVKTSIVLPAQGFQLTQIDNHLASGIAAELEVRLKKDPKSDTTEVLKEWADSTINLQVLRNQGEARISRSGNNWIIRFNNGQTLKAKVLINAGLSDFEKISPVQHQAFQPLTFETNIYRTSIAAGDYLAGQQNTASILTLSQLLQKDEENYVHLKTLSQSMAAGQAAGAIAAYAAFFKVKTSKTNLKAIQGELLNFKQALIPLADVSVNDSNWRAIQVMALMGVIKPELREGKVHFHPEGKASFDDVKEAISAFYYKAHIWFEDHANAKVDVDQAISLICYVGNKSIPQVKKEVEKKWKPTYKFKDDLATGQVLTRRQFSVLLYDYLQLFDMNIDASGRIIK